MKFDILLSRYRAESLNPRAQGDKFERLMQRYLQTDPTYANTLDKVWLWSEFPFRNQFGGTDTGIDLVAATFSGEYWAIQCKFYAENATMDKSHVDAFITTSARTLLTKTFAPRALLTDSGYRLRIIGETMRNKLSAISFRRSIV
jgi:predicted helicase